MSGSEESLVLEGCHVVKPCLKSLHGTNVLLFLLNFTTISKVSIFFYKEIIKSAEVRSKFAFRKKGHWKNLKSRGISFIF